MTHGILPCLKIHNQLHHAKLKRGCAETDPWKWLSVCLHDHLCNWKRDLQTQKTNFGFIILSADTYGQEGGALPKTLSFLFWFFGDLPYGQSTKTRGP